MEYFIDALRHYADFQGRIRRKAYWMFILFYLIIYVVLSVVDGMMGSMLLSGLFAIGMLVPSIAMAARRLHDTGRSGWWQLIALLPIIGGLILLIFLIQDSQQGENDYGDNPKMLAEVA